MKKWRTLEWRLLKDNHAWAFYYSCRKAGDFIDVIDHGEEITVRIWELKDANES